MPVPLSGLIGATTALTVLIVTVITLSVSLTFAISALRDIGTKHTRSLVDLAEVQLQSYMSSASHASRAIGQHWLSGPHGFPSEDPTNNTIDALGETVLATYRATGVAQLSMFMLDGSFAPAIAHFRDPQHTLQELIIPRGGVVLPRTKSFWTANATPSPAPLSQGFPGFDVSVLWLPGLSMSNINDSFTGRPFDAMLTNAPSLAVVPLTPPVQIWQVGVARACYNTSGVNIGIAWGTFEGSGLSTFLRSAQSTPNSHAFLTSSSDELMFATTHPAPWNDLTTVAQGTVPPPGCATTETTSQPLFGGPNFQSCRVHASNYGFAPFREAFTNNLFQLNEVVHVKVDGEWYFLGMAEVRPVDTFGEAFRVRLMLPEADIVGDITRGRNIAIGVAAAVFVLASVIALGIVVLLLRPLQSVSDRMLLAATFEDDDTTQELSAVSEVRELQLSYYAMNEELKRVSSFVPATVLANRDVTVDTLDMREQNADGKSDRVSETFESDSRSVRSVTSRKRSQGKSTVGIVGAGLNVQDGLSERSVTVAMLNCQDFTHNVLKHSRTTIATTYAAFIDKVEHVTSEHGGLVDSFHGDRLMLTFNGARPIAQGPRRAALVSVELCSAVYDMTGCALHVGIASGRCDVGNAGGSKMKRFILFGPAVARAAALCALAPRYSADGHLPDAQVADGSRVLVSDNVRVELSTHFIMRPLDIVHLKMNKKPNAVVSEVVATADETRAEEWLYVVGNDNASPAAKVAKVFDLLAQGDVPNAMPLLADATQAAATADGVFGPAIARATAFASSTEQSVSPTA